MLEVLDSPEIRKCVAPITIDRYHRMIESGIFDEWQVELLGGVLVEKMSKSKLHIFVVQVLYRLLMQSCREPDFLVQKEDPITVGNSELEPDLSVIRGAITHVSQTKPTSAQFVIEVAISSLVIDRAKAADYAVAGIPEYWIVRPDVNLIEVYREPVDGIYCDIEEVSGDETLSSVALPEFSLHLAHTLVE